MTGGFQLVMGVPQKRWMVCKGKSHLDMDDETGYLHLGVLPIFGTPMKPMKHELKNMLKNGIEKSTSQKPGVESTKPQGPSTFTKWFTLFGISKDPTEKTYENRYKMCCMLSACFI